MEETGLVVHFEGPAVDGGQIDAETAALMLNAVSRLVKAVNAEIGDSTDVSVNLYDTNKGTFDITFMIDDVLSNIDPETVVDVFDKTTSTIVDTPFEASFGLLGEKVGLLGYLMILYAFRRILISTGKVKISIDAHGEYYVVMPDTGEKIQLTPRMAKLLGSFSVETAVRNLIAVITSATIECIKISAFNNLATILSLDISSKDAKSCYFRHEPHKDFITEKSDSAERMKWLQLLEPPSQNPILIVMGDSGNEGYPIRVSPDVKFDHLLAGDIFNCCVRSVQCISAERLYTDNVIIEIAEVLYRRGESDEPTE